jgi:hypothetical protein
MAITPSHLLAVGLIIAVVVSGLALTRFIWQHRTSRTIVPAPLALGGAGPTQPSDLKGPWIDDARLTIAFDKKLQRTTALRQEAVRCYHWYSVPGVTVDWGSRKVYPGPGDMLIFLEFDYPTHLDYSRIRVVNSSIESQVLSTSLAGAVIRAIGDMRGRTIDIRFSKNPILD